MPSFAFLNNESHPVGRLMLQRLCSAGLVPRVIIEERSPFADKKTTAYLRCLKPEEIPLPTEHIARNAGVPYALVGNLNKADCVKLIQDYETPLLLLGNARILKPEILTLPRHGCINVHPGVLPWIRGAFPQCWAIVHNFPIECTCHYVDEGVDTGPILGRREVPVFDGDTLEEVVSHTMFASADLLCETVRGLVDDNACTTNPQTLLEGTTFHWPSAETLEIARGKLARGEYQHLKRRNVR